MAMVRMICPGTGNAPAGDWEGATGGECGTCYADVKLDKYGAVRGHKVEAREVTATCVDCWNGYDVLVPVGAALPAGRCERCVLADADARREAYLRLRAAGVQV